MRDNTFADMDAEELIDDALSIEITPKYDSVGVDSDVSKNLLCATVKARDLEDDDHNRAAVDIVVALDISGSMAGNKLNLCKKTLEVLVRCLSSNDKFGLVTYSSQAVIAFPPKLMTQKSKEDALKTIKSLYSQGSTNISDAIGLACQELRNINDPNEVRVLFLLTDGHANVGIREPSDLVELAKNCSSNDPRIERKRLPRLNATYLECPNKLAPIIMHTFGYGEDHNAILLRDLADSASGGSYYFVDDDASIGTAFGDALGGVLSVVAQSVVLLIQPSSINNITKVYHDQATKRDNGAFTVTLGDFYAEETRDIILEIDLIKPTVTMSEKIPHVSVSISYTDTIKKMPVSTVPINCSIARPSGTGVSDANKYVLKHWLRIDAAQQMKEAEEMGRNQQYGEAKAKLEKWQAKALNFYNPDENEQVDMMLGDVFADMKECVEGVSSEREFMGPGQKKMLMKRACHMNQRSTMPSKGAFSGTNSYATKRKKKTSDLFQKFM